MSRKILSFLVALILTVLCTAVVAADDSSSEIQLTNSEIVTNDINSTYIAGTISPAAGQKILVKQGFKTIVTKTVPASGKTEAFMVKLPPSRLNTKGSSYFRVMAATGTSDSGPDPIRVKITYKPREKQTIEVPKSSFALTVPGVRKPINAKTPSGQDLMYVSENPDVVKVDDNGNLVPVGKGSATVSVIAIGDNQFDGAKKDVKVSVKDTDGYLVAFHSSIDDKPDQVHEQIVAEKTSASLDSNTFENGDHEFLGWAVKDGGPVVYDDGDEIEDLAEKGKTADLYAVWTGDGANAAVAWAIKIAEDDSFSYGARPATAAPGCYFCGTNHGPVRYNKPAGYEKTYVCMTFVHAAYAHGAEDPEMLADCQAGRYTLSLHDWNFSHWNCWKKIGRCSELSVDDLEPGDVIIWWADNDYSGHASIYAGDNNIVDAGDVGWGADTIAVRYGKGQSYLNTGARHDSRSYVMRYVPPEEQ